MKLVYKILDFFRGNKRKKPIKKPLTQKQIAQHNMNEAFARSIRKEREIGVHPKYLHSSRTHTLSITPEEYERVEKEWEKKNV